MIRENVTKIIIDDSPMKKIIVREYRRCMSYKNFLFNKTLLYGENETQLQCPVTFDGWLCWGAIKAGAVETQNCPSFVAGFDPNLIASKTCLSNGSWFEHPSNAGSNKTWSNYTGCINHSDYDSRQLINEVYFYGYCASFFTLIISLIIFLSFRSLQCTRIRIHTQLFTSLALNCIFWMLWYKFIVESPDVVGENSLWCVVIFILTQYFMMCNYFWMFCEGVHLHLVLVVVFIKDNIAMRIFYVIGWILPLIYVTIYSVLRSKDTEENKLCWIDESRYRLILVLPVMILLVCSLIFLINIVRVLITKLHPKSTTPAPLAIKKAVRATFILIPLFGLQHILLPFRPDKNSSFEFTYQLLSAVLISLQGVCVSFLFCFINHEVITAVLSYLSTMCPKMFTAYRRESYYAPAQTTTRDITV